MASAQQFKDFCGRCRYTIGDGSFTSTSSFHGSEIKDNGVECQVLFFRPILPLHQPQKVRHTRIIMEFTRE